MDNSTIGIKIADGTFFPVIEEDSRKKKRLVLTTVNDDQGSVQIDLYKGSGKEIADAAYIGSLVIEDIMPAMKGEPEIELVVGVDEDGNLNAVAGDAGSDDKQSLSVSLESLGEDSFTAPNFELDDAVFEELPDDESAEEDFSLDGLDDGFNEESLNKEEFPEMDEPEENDSIFDEVPSLDEEPVFDGEADFGEEQGIGDLPDLDEESAFDEDMSFKEESSLEDDFSFDEEAGYDEEPAYDEDSGYDEEPGYAASEQRDYTSVDDKKRSPLALIVIIILILAILGVGAFFIIRSMSSDTVPPLEAEKSASGDVEMTAEAQPQPEVESVSPEVAEPEVGKTVLAEPEPPVETETAVASRTMYDEVPPAGRGGGVWYRLKWGDTLWDLSNSFYRTPWLYGLIAVENNIKNPDIIYAGTDIIIPEN